MEVNICKATTSNDKPCKNPCLTGREFCFAHDPDPVSRAKFLAITAKGGKKPRTLIAALKGFKAKDSVDFAEAVRRILEMIIAKGLIKTTKDVAVFNSLVGTFLKLEQGSIVPAKMREIELKLAEKNKALSKDKTAGSESGQSLG
ncbi:hypothetical protein A2375_02005 [Candidatus Woesebacteria bacterium RIFOXYB1_FULL_31_120]|nr:MAG: hypothetical protein A2375_02005 [Candidatus Woesebacteria bacterium RIFOXYB1_FULL_31_120]